MLENFYAILDNVENYEQILKLENDILSVFNNKKTNISNERLYYRQFLLSNDFLCYVSKSAKDAEELLKNLTKGNDYWFHIRDYAGSHVVVKYKKEMEITNDAKLDAALLALYYSKGRNSDYGDIYFTQVKYLHKSKGGPVGTVFPTREKNIKVDFDKNRLESIFTR